MIRVAVLVQSRTSDDTLSAAVRRMMANLPHQRQYLSHGSFERRYGADPEKLSMLASFAREHQLDVLGADSESRLVVLSGTMEAFRNAFQVEFAWYRHSREDHHTITGDVHVPAELAHVVEAVFGLDSLPRFDRPMTQFDHPLAGALAEPLARPKATDPGEIRKAYAFPEATGRGQSIAVILLGGGFHQADLEEYFTRRALSPPRLRVIELAGGRNDPVPPEVVRDYLETLGLAPRTKGASLPRGVPTDAELVRKIWWTIEATLDVELLGTFAHGAEIVVYFAPNNELGKIEALAAAINDRENNPSVITCSWGAREDDLHGAFLESADRLFRSAALKGITVCYSSGDHGANLSKDGKSHVQFPASSPHVLACGGTRLPFPSSEPESAWNESRSNIVLATGGGFSGFFPRQSWQAEALAGKEPAARGVPDVAGKADMMTGYEIVVGGASIPMGGTSAAAPLWAGLAARFNEGLGARVGWLTPLLYRRHLRKGLKDITRGDNGSYRAGPGWDPCTGLGSPHGKDLLAALRSSSD